MFDVTSTINRPYSTQIDVNWYVGRPEKKTMFQRRRSPSHKFKLQPVEKSNYPKPGAQTLNKIAEGVTESNNFMILKAWSHQRNVAVALLERSKIFFTAGDRPLPFRQRWLPLKQRWIRSGTAHISRGAPPTLRKFWAAQNTGSVARWKKTDFVYEQSRHSRSWLIDWLYPSFTAHQHQKGHTVPKQRVH